MTSTVAAGKEPPTDFERNNDFSITPVSSPADCLAALNKLYEVKFSENCTDIFCRIYHAVSLYFLSKEHDVQDWSNEQLSVGKNVICSLRNCGHPLPHPSFLTKPEHC